ncbi:hypothetical protein R6Q57_028837 [Mikania cordata]
MNLQGNPIDWVSTHRFHHQYCDSERDPHSPIEGFCFSHMSWLFDTDNITKRVCFLSPPFTKLQYLSHTIYCMQCGEQNNVGDLEKQPFYRFLRKTYIAHQSPSRFFYTLPVDYPLSYGEWYMIRLLNLRNNTINIGVRIVWVYHITWLVNSACHVWGHQAWDTGDLSRNNWRVGILAFGGWHNNHHTFEYSARHGLEWWQVDMTWYMIRLLEVIGLAEEVKLPVPTHIQRMGFSFKS